MPLALQLTLNPLNAGLCVLFVVGFGWGIAGVARATLSAEYATVLVGAALVARADGGTMGAGLAALACAVADGGRILRLSAFRPMLVANRDILIRTFFLIGAFAWFTARGARLGDVTLAANALLLNFQTLTAQALDGFALAAEALVGEAQGAADRGRLIASVRAAARAALIFACALSAIYLAAGPFIIDRLTDLTEVRFMAHAHFFWLVLSPILSVWCFMLDGIFIGATRTAAMRNAMALSLVAFVALTYVTTPIWGNHGLWAAFLAFLAVRGITLGLRYPALLRAIRAQAHPRAVSQAYLNCEIETAAGSLRPPLSHTPSALRSARAIVEVKNDRQSDQPD